MNKIRVFILLVACLLFSTSIFADNVIVKGRVTDGGGKPIEGVVASWLSLSDSTLIANAVTDSTGVFVLEANKGVPDSTAVVASCIGYERQQVALGGGNEDILIRLKETSHQLKGVTVTAKSSVKGVPGGLAFTPGGAEMLLQDGLELLKVTPMLDVQGDVQILGKGAANVYINGHDPHMPVGMVLQMLRTVPPKNIQRIEVMYNPGASQRASDQSGIVNIIMKRPDYGWNGQVGLNALYRDARWSGNTGVYLGYGHGKFRFSASTSLGYSRNLTKAEQQYEYKADGLNVKNESRRLAKTLSGGLNANATYDITEKSQVGVSAGVSLLGGLTRNETATTLADLNAGTTQQFLQTLKGKYPVTLPTYSLTAFYTLNTDNRGSSLDVSVSYTKSGQTGADTMNVVTGLEREDWLTTPYREQDTGDSHGVGVDVKYKKIFADGSYLRAGAAYDISHIDNDNQFFDFVDGVYTDNRQRSNRFVYDENVAGAYVEYNRTWSKVLSSSVGLRAEYTHTHGNQHTTGETFSHDWLHLFPNVGLSFNSLNQKHSVGIDYSTSVWRPTFNRVNPFKNWTSSNTYSMGNPDMKPQRLHFLTLKYRFLQWYEFSVLGLYQPHVMSSYTVQGGDGVSKTVYGEVGKSRGVHFSLSAYKGLFGGRWYVNSEARAGWGRQEGKVGAYPLDEHYWDFSANVMNTVLLNKARDFALRALYSISGRSHQPSETRPVSHYVSASLSKSFGFGGTLSLGFTYAFPWKDKTFYDTSTYYRQSRNLTSPMTFTIGFSQEFGKKRVRGASERGSSKFEQRMK